MFNLRLLTGIPSGVTTGYQTYDLCKKVLFWYCGFYFYKKQSVEYVSAVNIDTFIIKGGLVSSINKK